MTLFVAHRKRGSPEEVLARAHVEGLQPEGNRSLPLKAFSRLLDYSEGVNVKYSFYGNPPIYHNELFPWSSELERNWRKIRAELDAILPYYAELPNFQDISSETAGIQTDNQWKTFFFYGYGLRSQRNCAQCPETARLLAEIPGMKTAFFSILAPRKHIPPHRGPYNGVLRYHLGLLVPEPKERCRIRVHKEFRHWEEGQSIIFDDSFNHEVWNDTDGMRAVLFVDFLRPVAYPASVLRDTILKMVTWTPFITAGKDREDKWEAKFYGHNGPKIHGRTESPG